MGKTDAIRIVIPRGMGHLGRILAQYFSRRGDNVTVLTRSASSLGATVDASGIKNVRVPWGTLHWDSENLGERVEALEGADVLINLAGRSVNCRYTPKNQREILESRLCSTQVLGEAISGLGHPPKVWINASTATIYLHTFDRAMDEASGEIGVRESDAPTSWRFSVDVATRWEQSFFEAVTPRTRKVAPRGGMVMSPYSGGIFE